MPFVRRDNAGKVKGVYAMKQVGYAEEELAEDHTDLIAYRAPAAPDPVSEWLDDLRKTPGKLAKLKSVIEGP